MKKKTNKKIWYLPLSVCQSSILSGVCIEGLITALYVNANGNAGHFGTVPK